jgi:hypothetical protein
MSIFGPGTPASVQPVSGVKPTERKARPGGKPSQPESVNRGSDEVEVSGAMSSDAVRNLKSNGQEETIDDRQQQDNYQPQKKAEPRPSLDVKG